MSKDAPDYQAQLVFHAMFWVLIFITLLGVLARVYIRVYLRGSIFRLRSWHISDILVAVSWFGFFTCGFIELFIFLYYDITPSSAGKLNDELFAQQAKLGVTFNTTFWFWVFVVKLAMLFFLDELIPKHQMRPSWIAIRVVGALVIISGVTSFVWSFLWCLPFKRQWTRGLEFCWDIAALPNRRAQRLHRQIWHCLTDVLILAIPIPLIPRLSRVNKRQRIGAAVMLFLGVFCTISAFIYTYYTYRADTLHELDDTTAKYMQYEPIVELAAAIFIQCVPSVKCLFSHNRGQNGTNVSEISGNSANRRWGSDGTSKTNASRFKKNTIDEEGLHVLEMQTSRANTMTPIQDSMLPDVEGGTWKQISDSAVTGHDVSDPRAGWS